jgi:hypothetical protein
VSENEDEPVQKEGKRVWAPQESQGSRKLDPS